MIKYFCDCCKKEVNAILKVSVRDILPLSDVHEPLCFVEKELCLECKGKYRQRVGVTLVAVWEDMCRENAKN